MRQLIFIVFMTLASLSTMGQSAGGQITRSGVSQNKPHVSASKPRSSNKPVSKPNSGRKDHSNQSRNTIIQNIINNMVYVKGGTFMMGATSEQGSDAYDNENPSHQVTLSSFYIGKYEVTQEEWEAIMGTNPSRYKGKRRPVEFISWEDCQLFIMKLNRLTNKRFRLPTEAEWEYAARGGKSGGTIYAGSNNVNNVAWLAGNSDEQTHNVGLKQPNGIGLYDMSGNVGEWCSDWYGSYNLTSQKNPTGPYSGRVRVFRGGSWHSASDECRVFDRQGISGSGFTTIGLRLALTP